MGVKHTVVIIRHDEGYGDELINYLNLTLRGKDMIAESVYKESDEVNALKEALKNARNFVREVANVTSRDFASAIGITATQLSAWTSEEPKTPPDFIN